MKTSSVVCTIEFRFNKDDDSIRDIAKTQYRPANGTLDSVYEISSRGNSYIYSWAEEPFKLTCARYRVRFIPLRSGSTDVTTTIKAPDGFKDEDFTKALEAQITNLKREHGL